MANTKNLRSEIEILKANSKILKNDNSVHTSFSADYSYVKSSLLWSLIYIIIALFVIFVVSVYTGNFSFDLTLRHIFHISQIAL
jgi:hypothetical protein